MESHIERLVAACGLRHFGYRQFGAPELAIPERAVVAEADAPPPVDAVADIAPVLVTEAASVAVVAPAMETEENLARPPLPVAAARPPITLATPPEPDDRGALPAYPDWNLRMAAQQARAPVSLPPPAPLPLAGTAGEAPRRGRPPIVLPAPEIFDSSMAPPAAPSGPRPPVQRASQPRLVGDRRAPEIVATPPIRLPPVTDAPAILRPIAARPAASRPTEPSRSAQPGRRFALLEEIRPPAPGGSGTDQPSSPHSP